MSGVEEEFPIVLETDEDDFVKRRLTANVIQLDDVKFLCRMETIKEWRTKVDFEDDRLKFKDKGKNVEIAESEGDHLMAKLELMGTWKKNDAIYLVEREIDVSSDGAVKKLHKILNH